MSTVKANNVQVGQSGTASQNFTLYQPSTPDGTVRLAVGNSGATTGDVLSVSSTGLSVTGTLTSTGVNTFPAGSASAPSITTTGDTNTGVFFPAADTAAITTGGTERMRITSGGDVQIANGNLVISTSGKGIDFSATPGTGTSELLADYEEGTWTPSLGGNTTYSDQTGVYTKVGRQVTAKFRINVTSIGTGSTTTISGLPFTVGSGYDGTFAPYFETTATNIVTVVGLSSVTSIYLYSATAATASLGSNAIFKNGTTINGIVTYFV